MAGPMNNVEIEDVLSSIRRLVSEEGRGARRAPNRQAESGDPAAGAQDYAVTDVRSLPSRQAEKTTVTAVDADKLVLSPAFRIPDVDSTNSPDSHMVPSSDLASLEATIAELEAAVGAAQPGTGAETISATAAISGLDLPAEDWTDSSDLAGLPDSDGLSRVPAFVSRQARAFDPARFDAVAFDHAAAQTLQESWTPPDVPAVEMTVEEAELAADRAFAEQSTLDAALPVEDEAGFINLDQEQAAAQVYDFAAHVEAKAQAAAELNAPGPEAESGDPEVLSPEAFQTSGADTLSVYDADTGDFPLEDIAASEAPAADFVSGDSIEAEAEDDFAVEAVSVERHSLQPDAGIAAMDTALAAPDLPFTAPSQLDLAAERAAAAEPPLRAVDTSGTNGSRTADPDAFAWSAGQGLSGTITGIAASLAARNSVVPAPRGDAPPPVSDRPAVDRDLSASPAAADPASVVPAGGITSVAETSERAEADFGDFELDSGFEQDASPDDLTQNIDAPAAAPHDIRPMSAGFVEVAGVIAFDTSAEASPAYEAVPEAAVIAAAPQEAEEDDFSVFEEEETIIDEAALRALIATIIREELQGELGERITRNVRKLVRQEIQKALDSKGL